MIMQEFYRQRLAKIKSDIQDAELKNDFTKIAKLEAEESEIEMRVKEIQSGK